MHLSRKIALFALILSNAAWGHGINSYCSRHERSDPGPGVESVEIGGGGNSSYWEYQIFKSSPFNPPVWQINATGEPLAPGLIFITPSGSADGQVAQPAPQIFRDNGQLVWSGPTSNATNFKFQILDGEPILTFARGFSTAGVNTGHGYVNVSFVDSSYDYKTVLCPHFNLTIPGNETFECQADIHESFITDRNTILVSAYNATPTDLTVVGGSPDGWVFDCLFFELDPYTGDILFRWSALEHVSLTESREPLLKTGTAATPWDFFHINSVINIGDHYLINSRHTWTVYYTDASGDIVWRLHGETGGDFGPLPEGGTFRWQHHPRAHNVTETSFDMSLFNNNNQALDNSSSHPTNDLVYHLPFQPNNATPPVLRRRLANNPPLFADSQGSYQPSLSNGNQFTTFGQIPLMREYGPATDGGDVRWTARAGADGGTQLYRGFKEIWHATPSYPPALVVLSNATLQHGYVSWNGATDVTAWNVYEGETSGQLHYVGQIGFRGFETRFDVACWAKYVQVGAVVDTMEVKRSNTVSIG